MKKDIILVILLAILVGGGFYLGYRYRTVTESFTYKECAYYVGQATKDSYDMGFTRGVHCRGLLSAPSCELLLQKANEE